MDLFEYLAAILVLFALLYFIGHVARAVTP